MGLRRRAREAALQRLYQIEIAGDTGAEACQNYWDSVGVKNSDAREFAEQLVQAVVLHRRRLDEAIDAAASNWQLERLARIDLCVLRLAAAELLCFSDTPASVVIDEALEMARRFSNSDAPAFVNGVLDRVARENGLIGDSQP